ncbi:MAG: hypothetical protein ABIG91_02360 [Patescibacteria group bacterium]
MAIISAVDKIFGGDINLLKKQDSSVTAISNNQSGGITANNVNLNINQSQEPLCDLGKSEKTKSGEWLTKLTVKGIGSLSVSNWNILMEFNTDILRQEEADVSVGPWIPLQISKQLPANQKFIGFSRFDPGQYFTLIFYSKEPLKIVSVTKIPTQ